MSLRMCARRWNGRLALVIDVTACLPPPYISCFLSCGVLLSNGPSSELTGLSLSRVFTLRVFKAAALPRLPTRV